MVFGDAGVAFRSKDSVGLLVSYFSGLNRTAHRARCLRFAARVTPRPRKTRLSGADQASGPGLVTRRVPSRTFAFTSQLMLPPPRLCLGATSATLRTSASGNRTISGLNSSARTPAVYASWPRSPVMLHGHARLASG
jgi:hypothetical protein